MPDKITLHENRAIIEIKGEERKKFLQGLVTNDVEKASSSNLIYAIMLSPQGRFLYDFFIFENEESLFLDCYLARRDEIIKKLNFYKLRSKVEIIKNDDFLVAQILESNNDELKKFPDPRSQNLGFRYYLKNSQKNNFIFSEISKYHFLRISNKIAESELDLTYDKSFILEFGFDDLNAIDYKKGCYVGQELTARTHYRGEIRKKLFHAIIDNINEIEKGCEVSDEEKEVGIVLSSIFYQEKLHALLLIRMECNTIKNNLKISKRNPCKLI
jgi:folate-binding protein YgfZ